VQNLILSQSTATYGLVSNSTIYRQKNLKPEAWISGEIYGLITVGFQRSRNTKYSELGTVQYQAKGLRISLVLHTILTIGTELQMKWCVATQSTDIRPIWGIERLILVLQYPDGCHSIYQHRMKIWFTYAHLCSWNNVQMHQQNHFWISEVSEFSAMFSRFLKFASPIITWMTIMESCWRYWGMLSYGLVGEVPLCTVKSLCCYATWSTNFEVFGLAKWVLASYFNFDFTISILFVFDKIYLITMSSHPNKLITCCTMLLIYTIIQYQSVFETFIVIKDFSNYIQPHKGVLHSSSQHIY
jgi:hypothetical protein